MIVKVVYGKDSVLPAAKNIAAEQLAILLNNNHVQDLRKVCITSTVTWLTAQNVFIVAHTVVIQDT